MQFDKRKDINKRKYRVDFPLKLPVFLPNVSKDILLPFSGSLLSSSWVGRKESFQIVRFLWIVVVVKNSCLIAQREPIPVRCPCSYARDLRG